MLERGGKVALRNTQACLIAGPESANRAQLSTRHSPWVLFHEMYKIRSLSPSVICERLHSYSLSGCADALVF